MTKKNPYTQGTYTPVNPIKYVGKHDPIYRSSFELRVFNFLDHSENVVNWASEPFSIPYFYNTTSDGSPIWRRYIPDLIFSIKMEDGSIMGYLAEIKPYDQTMPPKQPKKPSKKYEASLELYIKNMSKWKFAKEFCDSKNMTFKLFTEKEIFQRGNK